MRLASLVLSSLLGAGCIFGAGGTITNNSATNSNNMTSSTNNTTACVAETCSAEQCGTEIDDGCGGEIECPACCSEEALCADGVCGIVDVAGCEPVDCGGGDDASDPCGNRPPMTTAPTCGLMDDECYDEQTSCGDCDDEDQTCTSFADFASLCCLRDAEVCRQNPGVDGMFDAGDGCGPRPINCERPRFSQMVAGTGFTCAVNAARTHLFCWGRNHGAPNLGLFADRPALDSSPTPLLSFRSPASEIVDVSAGSENVCLLLANGQIHCRGTATEARSGDPDGGPFTVGSGAVDIELGRDFGCALDSNNQVWCWGNNAEGQAAPFSSDPVVSQPRLLAADGGDPILADAIYGGSQAGYFCLVRDGRVVCAGPTPAMNSMPVFQVEAGATVAQMGLAETGFLYDNDGPLQYTGGSAISLGVIDPPSPEPPLALEGGVNFFCATYEDAAYCIGQNEAGQLGTGDMMPSPDALVGVVATGGKGLAVGARHACVVGPEGLGLCWGANANGELGTGDTTGSSSPVSVTWQ